MPLLENHGGVLSLSAEVAIGVAEVHALRNEKLLPSFDVRPFFLALEGFRIHGYRWGNRSIE